MAKGNMLLGQARGKVGDIVFSRNNGRQVIKARSETVKNPQTTAQVLQRILLNTVSQAYSKMLAICDHSFEGVKTGQDTMAAFMKRNLNQLRSRVVNMKNQQGTLSGFYAVTPIGSKALAINPYIMATGTLPSVAVTGLAGSSASDSVAQITLPGVSETITYENLISAYGLNRGDQLTFITLNYDAAQGITFNYARIILDPMNADGTPALLSSQLIADGAILSASDRNQGNFARLTEADGVIGFSCAGGIVCGACVIVSRQATDGEWLRSNAVLQIPADLTGFEQWALLDAIDTFYSGGIDFESNWYLNNAERTTQEGSATPSTIPSLTSLMANSITILAPTAGNTVDAGSNINIRATVANYDNTDSPQLVFTPRTLTQGSVFAHQSGDIEVDVDSADYTGIVALSPAATYHVYFVNGGVVLKVCGWIIAQVATPRYSVDGQEVSNLDNVRLTQGVAHTVVINNDKAPVVQVDEISSSQTSLVAVSGASVNYDQSTKLTTISFAASVSAGTVYGIANAGDEGYHATVTFVIVSNNPSGDGGGENG